MIRGTTAQFKFKLPYAKDELTWATIKFWQPKKPSKPLIITKTLKHCDTPNDAKELCVSLTAEETARFSDKYKAKVQIRAQHMASGTVFGSREQLITVYPMPDYILEEDVSLPGVNDEGWIILNGDTIAEEKTDGTFIADGSGIISE